MDSRTKYYFDFASSLGFLFQQSIDNSIILYVHNAFSSEIESVHFSDIEAFGRHLKTYCQNNGLEFKPYKPGRGRGGSRINSGGKREGSGHPKGKSSPGSGRKPGFGRYGAEGGKLAWIPAKMTLQDIDRHRSMEDALSNLIQNYQQLADKSKSDSITNKPTRDWTKALELIDELNQEILKGYGGFI